MNEGTDSVPIFFLMTKIRFGIIGFGAFAERAILPAIRAAEHAVVTMIQKRSMDAARAKAEEHSVPFYCDSVEALVSHPEVDAVFIVSSNDQHHPATLLAAAHGKHVLVEKPMAVSLKQAQEMAEACRTAGVKLMVAHMLRFSPLIRRMKEIVQSGMIGRVTYARSHFFYNANYSQRKWLWDPVTAGAGPLFDIGIHCLDTMRYVLNDERVRTVRSIMHPSPGSGHVEGTSVLSLGFESGTLATIHSSYEQNFRESYIEFMGTEGNIAASQFSPSNTDTHIDIIRGVEGRRENVVQEPFHVHDLYTMEVEDLALSIIEQREPYIPVAEALHNQEILEKAMNDAKITL